MKRDASELVDLHNGEFCVDVSEWGDVEYTPLEREQCDSTFEKKCEMKTEQVIISRYHISYNISTNYKKAQISRIFFDILRSNRIFRFVEKSQKSNVKLFHSQNV